MDFNAASEYIIDRLRRELNPSLSYHCVEHTIDVIEATRRLAGMEKIEPAAKILLQTASSFHDCGMLIQYKDHESASIDLACQVLPGFGYTNSDIDEVARLIMVTRLPQHPYDHLEQIICDADLDYLGRDDFFINSFRLKLEWEVNGIRNTTLKGWFNIQMKFLTEHQYFTPSAILLRNEKKLRHLQEIKQLITS